MLAATTELLETVPLAELSVAQILDAAAVGRTSFYEHFSSKDDVVVKLLRSVSTDIAREIEPMFTRGERTPEEAFREGLTRLIRMWERYAPLMVTGSVEWPAIPELRRLWLRIHADLTRRIAAVIAADRKSGLAPAGADPEALAAALVWSTERALLVSRTGRVAALPGSRGAGRAAHPALRALDLRRRPPVGRSRAVARRTYLWGGPRLGGCPGG